MNTSEKASKRRSPVGTIIRFLVVAIVGPMVLVFCAANFYPLALWISGPWQHAQFEAARQQLDVSGTVGDLTPSAP